MTTGGWMSGGSASDLAEFDLPWNKSCGQELLFRRLVTLVEVPLTYWLGEGLLISSTIFDYAIMVGKPITEKGYLSAWNDPAKLFRFGISSGPNAIARQASALYRACIAAQKGCYNDLSLGGAVLLKRGPLCALVSTDGFPDLQNDAVSCMVAAFFLTWVGEVAPM
jgi:hypothetical protein